MNNIKWMVSHVANCNIEYTLYTHNSAQLISDSKYIDDIMYLILKL